MGAVLLPVLAAGLIILQPGDSILRIPAHDGPISSIAYRPDGRQLATGGFDRSIKLWTVAHGLAVSTLAGHAAPVTALAWSPDGRTLASGDSDGGMLLWRITSSSPRRMEGHPSCAYAIVFHPDGRTLYS